MSAKDGGPAFPIPIAGCNDGHVYSALEQSAGTLGGMSLRDYFAANATEDDVQFHMTHHFNNPQDMKLLPNYGTGVQDRTREQAKYQYADAMLAEREKAVQS